jgi:signal-transduction protein with cAMP-binding, CBS, and nucleotidyltransferase domain
MRVSELMHTPPVTCPSSMTVRDVARMMRDRNVGSVVVIDAIGYLAGIVTDRDLAVRCLGEGRSADIAVGDVMTRSVATVSLHTDVSDAAAVMAKRSIRRLPVVDEHDHAHGMVTLDDLVRHLRVEADALADTVIVQTRNMRSW